MESALTVHQPTGEQRGYQPSERSHQNQTTQHREPVENITKCRTRNYRKRGAQNYKNMAVRDVQFLIGVAE